MTALRRMRWWDLPEVVAIEEQVFADSPWSDVGFWSELAGVPATRTYVVADDDEGRVMAYAGLLAVGAEADVQTVGVRPDRQRGGLGRELMDALVAEARRRGCSRLMLEVAESNTAARALYERMGFEEVAVRRGYYGPGADALVLRLPLDAEGAVS